MAGTSRTLATLLLATAFAVGCSSKGPTCPEGFRPDEPRAARVADLLCADAEARALVPADGLRCVCWAPVGDGTVAPGPVLLLSSEWPEPEVAARVAHLLLHEREGLIRAVEAEGCSAEQLARTRAAEERAWALEGRVRARLGLPQRPSELERVMREYEAGCAAAAVRWEKR